MSNELWAAVNKDDDDILVVAEVRKKTEQFDSYNQNVQDI